MSISDITHISIECLIEFISSENLHPFFDIVSLIDESKSIINDEILLAMSNNPLCVNNLFDVNLQGTKDVTEKGIIGLLTSRFLAPTFNIDDFLINIKYKFGKNP